ncbi:MAG: hypothetical protein HOM34_04930 [Planctomycetes bacterium]|jgi:parvulin-like peptidyl-prolyl isomerase|nr:hypothetical protein [Planctomycetota bacterium]MBT4028605.1 hypothetical protein [Planctomycetota bacterium]MBT4559497.1 hypothetical protein [Planctomycetota bacterium]MBT5120049.1 hypothetical protein [Planctomycetota bacterium]MBT7318976.1 hypothetical protein [Planctomycetota bacterium]
MLTLLIPLFLAFSPPQDAPTPLPDGVLARIGTQDVSLDAYKDFLWRRFGSRGLRDFIGERLVQRAAVQHGIVISPELLQTKIEERITNQRGELTEEELALKMSKQGASLQEFRQQIRGEIKMSLTLDGLVMATRTATNEKLQLAFEMEYGRGGKSENIRHLVFMPNMVRMDAVRGGIAAKDINMAEVKQQTNALANAAWARLNAGEDFSALAAELSHDRTSKDAGGQLPHWNGRMYGPAFAEAVTSLQPGHYSSVIETPIGFHIVQLDKRVTTSFDSVRETLVSTVLNAPVTQQERAEYLESLHQADDIQLR